MYTTIVSGYEPWKLLLMLLSNVLVSAVESLISESIFFGKLKGIYDNILVGTTT